MSVASSELPLRLPEGRWRALERVAEGATAVVWRAHDEATGRVAAIKLARSAADAEVIARESAFLARVARRWGPALVDAGPSSPPRVDEGIPAQSSGA